MTSRKCRQFAALLLSQSRPKLMVSLKILILTSTRPCHQVRWKQRGHHRRSPQLLPREHSVQVLRREGPRRQNDDLLDCLHPKMPRGCRQKVTIAFQFSESNLYFVALKKQMPRRTCMPLLRRRCPLPARLDTSWLAWCQRPRTRGRMRSTERIWSSLRRRHISDWCSSCSTRTTARWTWSTGSCFPRRSSSKWACEVNFSINS